MVIAAASLVGRDTELADVLDACHRGEHVVLVGAPGVGTSLLLTTLVERLRGEGAAVVHLSAPVSLADSPLGIFLPLLPPQDWRTPTAGEQGAVDELARLVRQHLEVSGTRYVAVDDAHLLDAASAGLLLEIGLAGVGVLVALPDDAEPRPPLLRLWESAPTRRLRLLPLAEAQVRLVAAAALGGEVDGGLVAELRQRSHGLPLAVRELLRLAVREQSITRVEGCGGAAAPWRRPTRWRRCSRCGWRG